MNTIPRIFTAVVFLFTICSTTYSQSNVKIMQPSIAEDNIEIATLVDNWFHAKISGDFEAMKGMMAESFMIYGAEEKPMSRDEYVTLWKSYNESNSEQSILSGGSFAVTFPDGEMKGDWVYYTIQASWTPKGMEDAIVSWATTMAKIEEGKVAMAYHFQDNFSIMMQMGFTLSAPDWISQQAGE